MAPRSPLGAVTPTRRWGVTIFEEGQRRRRRMRTPAASAEAARNQGAGSSLAAGARKLQNATVGAGIEAAATQTLSRLHTWATGSPFSVVSTQSSTEEHFVAQALVVVSQ